MLRNLGVEVSSRLSLMILSYDLSTVIIFSRRITYWVDVSSSAVIDSCAKVSVTEDAAVLNIGDNGMDILLMVPQVGIYL